MSANAQGKLYLGREYDVKSNKITEQPILYDVRHLTTHGVILGMTGSGKTGLGIVLLEEALLQGIPVLALDPKGDIANLLLTFPDLSPQDFAPWVDVEGARRAGLGVAEYAAQEARRWQEGLAGWGITGERIAQLREAARFTIFTPGSAAGQPVDVLHFFETPDLDWDTDEEALHERIGGIVSALLGLVGIEADPLQSPPYILLARIIEHVWRAGEKLDLSMLIRLLQRPPFNQVGAFELETFFPEQERFALARSLNNLIAAPGFEKWQEGTPLDFGQLLTGTDGRPRASIFYLAHLDDAQRAFFITLFLEAAREWLRQQSGTTNLRALIYFDEVFGFFPPYPANPPTKRPLMALIKQGRAAGLGVLLSTQNPADLDYKGLTNAGTWAIGALRAARDKERVLEGLEGAAAEAGAALDRRALDQSLGALKPRVFLLHDIRAGTPLFFHTRWAMAYLRGPLTRKQVQEVMQEQGERERREHQEPMEARVTAPAGLGPTPPALPPELPQVFLAPTVTIEWALRDYEQRSGQPVLARERRLVYVPHLLALGVVRFLDRERGLDHQQAVARLVQPGEGLVAIDWDSGQATINQEDLSPRPTGEGWYAAVPAMLARPRDLQRWQKDFADYVYHSVSATIWRNPALKLYGKVGESRHDFRLRCEEEARRLRDAEIEKARVTMDRQMARVQEKLRREQRELAEDQQELEARKREELLGLGESAFNLLTGRRSSTLVSRASTKHRLKQRARADVEESQGEIKSLEQQLADLKAEWEDQVAAINDRWAETLEQIEEVKVIPRRTDVAVSFCGLAWVPVWQVTLEDGRRLDLPAREQAAQPG